MLEIFAIKSKETKRNKITGAIVPAESYEGSFFVVGVHPPTNEVYVIDGGHHYFIHGVQAADAWDATKWIFEDINGKEYDFERKIE